MSEIKYLYNIFTSVEDIKQIEGHWFVHFEGSRESLNFGTDHPGFAKGDKVKITFENQGKQNAGPNPTPMS